MDNNTLELFEKWFREEYKNSIENFDYWLSRTTIGDKYLIPMVQDKWHGFQAALSTQQPAVQGEAVAWQYRMKLRGAENWGPWQNCSKEHYDENVKYATSEDIWDFEARQLGVITTSQEVKPICWIRTCNGKIDWSEDCIGDSADDVLDRYVDEIHNDYGAIPLYTAPQQQGVSELVKSLMLILPLAKGYVALNEVGSNRAYISQAEQALAAHVSEGE